MTDGVAEPRGAIQGFSHVFRWTLPDFFSIDESFVRDRDIRMDIIDDRHVVSPRLTWTDSDWRLRLFPQGREESAGWVSADASDLRPARNWTDGKTETRNFVLGWKRTDGIVEERVFYSYYRNDNASDRLKHFLRLDELETRRSELLPSGALTLTFRVFRHPTLPLPNPPSQQLAFRVVEEDDPRIRPYGAVDHFSESVRWTVEDAFSSSSAEDDRPIRRSPHFTLAGLRWQLTACTTSDGHLAIYVRRGQDEEDSPVGITPVDSRVETVFHVGLERRDRTVEELKSGTTGDFVIEGPDYFWGWSDFLRLDDFRRRKSELLHLGHLNINFRVELGAVLRDITATPPFKRRSGEDVPKDRRTTRPTLKWDPEVVFAELPSREGGTCDVTFDVQGRQFHAHKSLLSARSRVFRAAFEHDTAEAQTGIVTIPDCDPDTFGEFLQFLDTGRLREVSRTSALSLYATSDKYDVQRLKRFCSGYLAQTLTTENFCAVVALADLHSDERLASAARRFVDRDCSTMAWASAWSSLAKDNPLLAEKFVKELAGPPAKIPRKK